MSHSGMPPQPPSDRTELDRPPPRPPGGDATQLDRPPDPRTRDDATQLDRTRLEPPGLDATQHGGAPPYPASTAPPGLPPVTPPYGAPPPSGPPAPAPVPPPYPPAGYPAATGYPEARGPQPPKRRNALFAFGGAFLAALLVIAAVVFVVRSRGEAESTPIASTPLPNTTSVASTASATTAATPVPTATQATPSPTVAATSTPVFSGPTDSWTDREGRVTVRFPADWKKETFDTRDENATLETSQSLLELTGPDSVEFSVTVYRSDKPLDDDVRAFRESAENNPKLAFRADQTQDVTIGGERGKLLTGTYMQNGAPVSVAVWFADHDGKRFGFAADRLGTHRADVDAIMSTVTFTPAGARTPVAAPASATASTVRPQTALATTSSIFGTPTATRRP